MNAFLFFLIVQDRYFSESEHFVIFLTCTYIDLWAPISRNVFRLIDSKDIVKHKPFSLWLDWKVRAFKVSKIMLSLAPYFSLFKNFLGRRVLELADSVCFAGCIVPRILGFDFMSRVFCQSPVSVLPVGHLLLLIWSVPTESCGIWQQHKGMRMAWQPVVGKDVSFPYWLSWQIWGYWVGVNQKFFQWHSPTVEMMDMLISLAVLIVSQCVQIPKYHVVWFFFQKTFMIEILKVF